MPPRNNGKVSANDLHKLPAIHSIEAERAVIGAMLSDPDNVVDEARSKLKMGDFFLPAHQHLFKSLCDMEEAKKPIDPSTVLQYLTDHQILDQCGGAPVIAELASGVISVLTAPTHIKTVFEKSVLRQLQDAACRIVYGCQDRQHEFESVVSDAEELILKITDKKEAVAASRHIAEVAIERVESIKEMRGKTTIPGIPTGLPTADRYMGGWQKRMFYSVNGRPGDGKTTSLMNFAREAAMFFLEQDPKDPEFVDIITMEMTDSQLVDKVFADLGNIPFSNIRDARLSDHEMETLSDTSALVQGLPIRITEVNHMTPALFRAMTNRMVRKGKSGLILLDYWQLCYTSTDEGTKRNEQAAMSRAGKTQSRSLNIPIIFAAQLNRMDGRPSLKHIAECDNLARDCDLAMLLERVDEKKDTTHGYRYGTNMLLRKNRQGPNRDIPLIFEGSFQRLVEEGYDPEAVK